MIMEKETAIKVLKELHDKSLFAERTALETLIPELKKSEDERIRKELIEFIKSRGGFKQEYIAWLEKQANHANFCNKIQIGDKVTRNEDGVLVNLSQLNRVAKKDEKQGEQKPINYNEELKKCRENPLYFFEKYVKLEKRKPADKVKPKFKVGDWVINRTDAIIMQIVNDIDFYESVEIGGQRRTDSYNYVEWDFRLWTIADAKKGDVLYMDNGSANCIFIYKSSNNGIINKYASYNNFGFEGEHYLVLNDGYVIPATKEQCDLLFQKMKESGYEWDAEKKELRKIEQKFWGEEDEKVWKELIEEVKDQLDSVPSPDCRDKEDEKALKQLTRWLVWLKSLKERCTWKPSYEQMDALYTYIYNPQYFNSPDPRMELVISVYEDLKKLVEE